MKMGEMTDTQFIAKVKELVDPARCALHGEKIKNVEDNLTEIKDGISQLKKKLIDGNGNPSLITSHELLKQAVSQHLEMHGKSHRNKQWSIGHMIAIGLCLVTLLVSAYFTLRSEARMEKQVQELKTQAAGAAGGKTP